MFTLYCTPLGETMRDEFTQALMKATLAGNGREQAYLLPGVDLLQPTRHSIQAMGLRGYETPNLLVFDELVAGIAHAAGCRQRRMSRMTQELLVAEVLEKLKSETRLPYFSTIAAFPGYVSAVTSLLAEIKRTGAPPEEFFAAAQARDWPAKDREVFAVYEAYQQRLADLELADLEEIYFLAIAALKQGKVELPYRHLYISEFYILTPLQLEVIRELRPRLSMDVGIIFEKNRPEVFAAVEGTYGALVGMDFTPRFVPPRRRTSAALDHLRQNLFQAGCQTMQHADGVSAVSSPNRGKELAVVAARVKELLLDGSIKPEEIAVVGRDTAVYADFRLTCRDFGLPVALPWEESLAEQPLVRLLEAAITARLDQGSRESVLNLVKSPLVAKLLPDPDELERAAAAVFIRSWRDWQKIWGRDLREDSGLVEQRKGFVQLRRAVGSLPRQGSCGQIAKALKDFIARLDIPALLAEGYRDQTLPLDRLKGGLLAYEAVAGTEGILDCIEQEVAVFDQPGRLFSLGKYLELFRKAVAAAKPLTLQRPADGGVQVVSPARIRGTAFRAVFILGLTDGEFPLPARENWLYDDRDRAAFNELGLDLPTAVSRRLEEDLYFAVAAALADELLVLCYREDAETMASPYIDEVLRLFAKDALPIERYSVSEIFPDSYDAVYSARDLTGRALLDAFGARLSGPAAPAIRYVLEHLVDGDLARRLAAEAGRGEGGSSYNGVVGSGDNKSQFSITALEDYALCPFGYFAKRLLGLDEWAEKEEEAGFDIIGTIYHEALASFLKAHAGESLRPEKLEDYSGEILAIVAAIFDRLIADNEIVAGKLWQYQRQRLEKVLLRWLEYEIGEQAAEGLAFTPHWFEWGFGLPLRPGMDRTSVTSPLTLELAGQEVNIVGKVDRIDRVGDKLAVIDYKRKSCPSFRRLAQGVDLQAALYIMAVERFLCPPGGEVTGGGYYSVEARKKEGGMWRADFADAIRHRSAKRDGNLSREDWAALQETVRQQVFRCVEGIRSGRFPVEPAADCPPYCVAREICRYRKGGVTKNMAGGDTDGC